jgi:hypothetical protein
MHPNRKCSRGSSSLKHSNSPIMTMTHSASLGCQGISLSRFVRCHISAQVIDQFALQFRLLSKPCSVIRSVTIDAINKLDAASEKDSKESRVVFSMLLVYLSQVSIDIFSAGPRGCGKSFLLLQALQYCNARDWLVLYIPRGPYISDFHKANL